MKKILTVALTGLASLATLAGCTKADSSTDEPSQTDVKHTHEYVYENNGESGHKKTCKSCDDVIIYEEHIYDDENDLTCNDCGYEREYVQTLAADLKDNLSQDGYVEGKIDDFKQYENTDAYVKVSNADELIDALLAAKTNYKNVWDEYTGTFTQVPADGYTLDNFEGTVHVIEITNDINLGYYTLSDEVKKSGLVTDFANKKNILQTYTMSEMFLENGMSQINISNTSDLLIYSKNGAKLTHGGFKVTSCDDLVFRNISFDEMWQWEDSSNVNASKVGDYDAFGWAYFKIAFCGAIWVDHCTFGKSYDGQIDYSNVDYTSKQTYSRAPYGADGSNGLHISWCDFAGGSDDKDGYIYKMMEKIEDDYQNNGGKNYLYYKTLRDAGVSFEDILDGFALPQKKGFLCGDDCEETKEDYKYNLKLQVSFANTRFTNLDDRLPKVRGGNAYMYNCVVDSSRYYEAHTKLKGLKNEQGEDLATIVKSVNSSWKCALTSQGMVVGNRASVRAENVIYRGISELIKHNDTKASAGYVDGGFEIINSSYQKGKNDSIYVGNSADENTAFISSNQELLNKDNFLWHTVGGKKPFTPSVFGLDVLESILDNSLYGCGAGNKLGDSLLETIY